MLLVLQLLNSETRIESKLELKTSLFLPCVGVKRASYIGACPEKNLIFIACVCVCECECVCSHTHLVMSDSL